MQPVDYTRLRIGLGHDTHRLNPGGPLLLGGIDIPFSYSAVGHSDADVLLHAVTDAILGAAALGDIGEMFPDTDPINKDRDSAEMLSIAMGSVKASGYEIINLDCIVFLQKPKLSPHKRRIAERIAAILEISPQSVGIKAKTGEGMGSVGQQLAIMAQCAALLYQTP